MDRCDINVYTQWLDYEGDVAFEEGDEIKITLETDEVLIGNIDMLNGETLTLSTKILGDVDIELDEIKDICHID